MTDSPAPVPEDVAARLRENLRRIEGIEEFIDYAVPLLEQVEKHHGDGQGASDGQQGKNGSGSGGKNGDGENKETPEPAYPHAVAWVEEWFLPTFRRKVGGTDSRWCAQWWAHAEAMTRFEALWRSWEVQRLDAGAGLVAWLGHHLDPQLDQIMSADGPFAQCAPDRHEPLPQMPSRPAPAALLNALADQNDTAAA